MKAMVKIMKLDKLSQSEIEIMQVIWEADRTVTTNDIAQLLHEKGWKSQTISTFLSRLVDKSFLEKTTKGKQNFYAAAITKPQYQHSQTADFIDTIHSGSIKNFMAALVDGSNISESEIMELKSWLDEYGRK